MSKVIILQGIPASGKTTWAKQYIDENPDTIRVNKDSLREMLNNGVWSKGNEQNVLQIRDFIIENALAYEYNVIVDDTNLAQHNIDTIAKIAEKFGATVEIKIFEVSVKEAIERDLNREKTVGEKVIKRMARQKASLPQKQFANKPFDSNKRFCIFCDIDGTLALFYGKNPYDRDFENDEVNNVVRAVVNNLYDSGIDVFLFSGRSSKHKEQTVKWLNKQFVSYDDLFMRQENDNRADYIVKQEMLNQFLDTYGHSYNILGIFDDRKQVKRMFVENGIFVFDVNQFDVEF